MLHNEEILRISKNILDELKYFSSRHTVREPTSERAIFVANTFNDANKTLSAQIKHQQTVNISLSERTREPFIAYVETLENDEKYVYFVCRGYTPSFSPNTPKADFMDYHSDLGKAVEEEPGALFYTRGATGQILVKNLFKPLRDKDTWDAIQNEYLFPQQKYLIESLLELIAKSDSIRKSIEAEKDLKKIEVLQNAYNEIAAQKQTIFQGLRRHIRSRIALRDQQILDTVQGELFRTHFHSQIVITGGPGTGKTTTVIKRIARQTNYLNLSASNVSAEVTKNVDTFFHKSNWLLFTPTPLLKHYLKENISKEGLPASDDTVKVWDEERQIIARDVLRILKVKKSNGFTRTKTTPFASYTNGELTLLSDKFEEYYLNSLIDLFEKATSVISENGTSTEIISFFAVHRSNRSSFNNSLSFLLTFSRAVENLKHAQLPDKRKTIFNELADEVSRISEEIINELIKNIPNLLVTLCDAVKQSKEDIDSDSESTVDDEEIEPFITDEIAIELKAKNLLRTLIRGFSYSFVNGKPYNPPRYTKDIYIQIEVILKSLPNILHFGKLVSDRRAILPFSRGYQVILNRIPQYYREFRTTIVKSSTNKSKYEGFDSNKLADSEIDILIYHMLRNAWQIAKGDPHLLSAMASNIQFDNVIISNLAGRYRTQIAVDEATDFSTIQIACMCYLCHPQTFSVTLVGDLMQRVTMIGLKTWDECNFSDTKFIPSTIKKVYRQNPKLLKIASELYLNEIGEEPPFSSAYPYSDEDPDPLVFYSSGDQINSTWIAQRISETYLGNQLPTTAVFVASDDEIPSTVALLAEALEDYSIEVKGCPGGDILGTEGKVAVFSIQYIKGLEFETVFLLDIDSIKESSGELFDKYFYVGLTRAATFLAVTCKMSFPSTVKYIQHYFKESNWTKYAEGNLIVE
jgi:hypothetical protein